MAKDLVQLTLYRWNCGKKKPPRTHLLKKEQLITYFRSSCIRVLTIHIGFIKEFVTKARGKEQKMSSLNTVDAD